MVLGNLDAIQIYSTAINDSVIWKTRCPIQTEPLNCKGLILWMPFERHARDVSGSGWSPYLYGLAVANPYIRGKQGKYALQFGWFNY